MRKRVLSVLMTLCMVLTLVTPAMAAEEGPVAQIGDETYNTLDAAVAAATDGTTIELLANATTNGLNLSKNLTIQIGAETYCDIYPEGYCSVGKEADIYKHRCKDARHWFYPIC